MNHAIAGACSGAAGERPSCPSIPSTVTVNRAALASASTARAALIRNPAGERSSV
jgi:hypothetical protein